MYQPPTSTLLPTRLLALLLPAPPACSHRCPVRSLKPHQVLALDRGEAQSVLSVSFQWRLETLEALCQRLLADQGASCKPFSLPSSSPSSWVCSNPPWVLLNALATLGAGVCC